MGSRHPSRAHCREIPPPRAPPVPPSSDLVCRGAHRLGARRSARPSRVATDTPRSLRRHRMARHRCPQSGHVDVQVDGRRLDRGVPEQLLEREQVTWLCSSIVAKECRSVCRLTPGRATPAPRAARRKASLDHAPAGAVRRAPRRTYHGPSSAAPQPLPYRLGDVLGERYHARSIALPGSPSVSCRRDQCRAASGSAVRAGAGRSRRGC